MIAGPLPWLFLAPLAVLTDLLTIVFVCHYRRQFHGTDVVFISILVCMVLNALVVPLVPALLDITQSEWDENLCNFFVWSALTLRLVHVSSLAILSVHWSKILRTSSRRIKISTTTLVKVVTPVFWGVATIVGLLPIIGAVPDRFKTNKDCFFLLSDLGLGFVIFMIVYVLTMICISLVCSFDSLALIHYAKKIAFIKYGAGRFYLPRKNDGLSENYTVHERYGQLNFAADLCRLVSIVTCFSVVANHVPYVVIEFLYMSIGTDRSLSEELVTWLPMMEALVLPYFLWFGSRRYKHAISYIFKVHILRRNHDNDENPDSCTLQSFTRKIKDVHTLPRPVRLPNNLSPSRRTRVNATKIQKGEESPKNFNIQNKIKVNIEQTDRGDMFSNGGSLDSRSPRQFQRSGSSGSRSDQMKKKHLPSIFIDETLNDSSPKRLNTGSNNGVVMVRAMSETEAGSVHSMYYVSSDYHPDCLNTDSLPRSSSTEHTKSTSNPQTVTDGRLYLNRYNSNSLPRMHGNAIGVLSSSFGSIPRKKPPKMGLRSNSGSSSSLYRTHSRSSSGNIYILGHSRSASGTIFRTSNMTIPYIYEIQPGKERMIPRQSSEQSESEGIAGQYCESDIDHVLDCSSLRSEDIQRTSKPIEIPSVTYIEKGHISPDQQHRHSMSSRQNERAYPRQKDKEQLSDENDSGCMANCTDDNFESFNIHKHPNSATNPTFRLSDSELDGFTTSELLSSKPYSYLSNLNKSKTHSTNFKSPWINPELPEERPSFLDREKSVEYAFFNNQLTTSSDSTDVTPSLRFDENTDRGFEEALNASYNSRESLCSFNGAYVESVSECTDMGDFFDNHHCEDRGEFKTQAIVSRISPASFTDQLCEYEGSLPITKSKDCSENNVDFSESVNSGHLSSPSPWPTSTKNSATVDLSFESDFSNERQLPVDSRPYQDIEAVYF